MTTKMRLRKAIDELPDRLTIEEALERLGQVFGEKRPATLDQACPFLDDFPPAPIMEASEEKREISALLDQGRKEIKTGVGIDRRAAARKVQVLLRRLDAAT